MIKIKIESGLRIIIIGFFLLNYYCFFLFPISPIVHQLNSYKMKYGLAVVSLFSFLWFIIKKDFKLQLNRPLYLIIGLYLIVLYNIIFSLSKYGIHSGIARAAYPFLLCLLFFPIWELHKRYDYMRKALKYLTIINIVACVLLLMQSILYASSQIVFMHIYEYEINGKVTIRNGNIRITFLDTMLLFSLILSMDEIGNRTETKLDIWNVILSLCTVYFVSQTRSAILIEFACLLICVIKRNRKKSLKNILVLVGLFFAILAGISYVESYIEAKYIIGSDIGISTRLHEIEYYSALFKNSPISGYGMIDPQQGDIESCIEIVHGPSMRFSITDIGIIGQISRSGVLILIWYLWFVKYLFRKEHLKRHTCMSVFILLTSITLIILDAARIITMPLIFALYETDLIENTRTGLEK